MTAYTNIIVGGGLVAGYAARQFVKNGINPGDLLILSNESKLPYERPPLSKGFLAGEKDVDDILINEPDFYQTHGIDVKLETPVTRVNLDDKKLYAGGELFTYDKLLIATGASPRTFDLPGADLENIYYLRQVSDARAIREHAGDVDKAVVIGGSFIGMETSAVLQDRGVATTMVFPEDRVWQSFFTPVMSDFFEQYYLERGVTILPQREIERFQGNGAVKQVVTDKGDSLATEMVLAGIGVHPNSNLFKDSPLNIEDGYILVNRFLETNVPDVLAAGDVTKYRDVIFRRPLHVEHWDNAVNQGQQAANVMMGVIQPYEHVPYFFSDVFDLSYEFWGVVTTANEAIHRGSLEDGSFSVWWLDEDDRLVAAFVMNRPDDERELAPKWIKSRKKLSGVQIQNSNQLADLVEDK